MSWYARDAMLSTRTWDGFQSLMERIRVYRKFNIGYTEDLLWD